MDDGRGCFILAKTTLPISGSTTTSKMYACGETYNNTAESFNVILERAKYGVYRFLREKHLSRYLDEIGFRWNQRTPD